MLARLTRLLKGPTGFGRDANSAVHKRCANVQLLKKADHQPVTLMFLVLQVKQQQVLTNINLSALCT